MEVIYKFRAYPNSSQKNMIDVNFKGTRFVYNHYLALQMELYQSGEKIKFYNELSKDLTSLKQKEEYIWLQNCDANALQQSLRNLDKAFKNYFREMKKSYYVRYSKQKLEHFARINHSPTLYDSSNHPKFKSRKDHRYSYTTQNYFGKTQSKPAVEFKDGKIKIPKLGWVKIRDGRDINARILHATIEQVGSGKYYIYLCCTDVEMEQFTKTGNQIGIDLGIREYMCSYSDGIKEPIPLFYKESLDKIKKLHRELDRKEVGSANWEKARIKLAKAYEKYKNQKADYLQKLTTNLVKENDLICIEDLDIEGMMKNILGYNTFKANKRAAIKSCGLGEFVTELEYKTQWYGRELHKSNRNFPSSRLCNVCGYRNDELKDLKIKKWICPKCGTYHDRDINAAKNLLNDGLRNR